MKISALLIIKKLIEYTKKKSYNNIGGVIMTNEIKKELDIMVKTLIEKIKIEKVILFGSQAYGTPNPDSDIDLCIITEEKKRKLDLIREIRKTINPYKTHSMDILVYNSEEFNEKAVSSFGIEKTIKEKGVLIYG